MILRSAALGFVSMLCCAAQSGRWSQGGYLENRALFYPREGAGDPTQSIDEFFFRWESALRVSNSWLIVAGIDAQTDTHDQVERGLHLSWDDRGIGRPLLALRTGFVRYTRGLFRLELGKQVLRWGVMDLFPPEDRFAPRDLLSPSGSDYLGIWAARAVVDTGASSLEVVYSPRFTPSRAPLQGQRWLMLPRLPPFFTYRLRDIEYPGGPQFGARYHQVHSPFEYSLSFYEGFETLPSLPSTVNQLRRTIDYRAVYPKIRMFGADFTTPWRGLVWKAESAYVASPSTYDHDVWTYAVQAEKAWDKLQVSGSYVGEYGTDYRGFTGLALDRAVRKSFNGRITWLPTSKQAISGEWYLRQTGAAFVTRLLYSRKLTDSLRASAGWNWITGDRSDPIGRFYVNSFFSLQLRYSL